GSQDLTTGIIPSNEALIIGARTEDFTWFFNGSIDEVMVYNRTLSAAEINFSYRSNVHKYNNDKWQVWINQSGLVLGDVYTYNLSVTDTVGNQNSSETRTVLGNSVPSFPLVSHSPSTLDDLDPNIEITVTVNVSDVDGNFDSAILQWKNSSGMWNNVTMNNLTDVNVTTTMNASFFAMYEDNFTYNIWANDTEGSVNVSVNTILNVAWDCTWISTTSLPATAGYNENKNVGNLTITNTGDPEYSVSNCSLDFRISYNLDEGRIYYDDEYVKNIQSYTIEAENNTNITINATFGNVVKQEDVNITVQEYRGRSETSERNTIATLVTNQDGPYLYQSVSSYPSTVYLTPGNFEIKSYIRNLMGSATPTSNITAYNVTFSWTLPSGFTNSSGNISRYFENITDSGFNYNNINSTFTNLASMSPGSKTFTINGFGYDENSSLIEDAYNNTLITESVSIVFQCYSVSDGVEVTECGSLDGDYTGTNQTVVETPVGTSIGAPPAQGGITTEEKEKLFQTRETYELVRGEEEKFMLTVENPFDGIMEDVNVEITGFFSRYLRIDPPSKDKILQGESYDFAVHIESPEYLTKGEHTLNFVMTWKLRESGIAEKVTSMQENREIILIIHEISKERSEEYLNESIEMLEEMIRDGFNVEKIKLIVEQAQQNMENKNYDNNKILNEIIKDSRNQAVGAKTLISEIEEKIKEAEYNGLETKKTARLILLAKAALEREDYETAFRRADEAKLTYAIETVGGFNVLYFLRNSWKEVLSLTIFLLISIYFASLTFRYNIYKRKIRSLKNEENIIIGLIRQIQKDCFERNKMSMKEYMESLLQYENRMSKIVQDLIKYEICLINTFKILKGEKKRLVDEKEKIHKEIEKNQREYLGEGKIEVRIYQGRMKSYATRYAEIEERLAEIEATEAMKRSGLKSDRKRKGKKKGMLFLAVSIIAVLVAGFLYTNSTGIPTGLAVASFDESLDVKNALWNANSDLQIMKDAGLSTVRYNDLLMFTEQIYNIQYTIEKEGGNSDYSEFYKKINELQKMKFNAFKAMDELDALELTMNQIDGIDISEAENIYNESKTEFLSERYEKSMDLVNDAYEKISELESVETRIAVFYEATSRNITSLISNSWKEILIAIGAIVFAFFMLKKPIKRKLIKRKIKELVIRKETLKDMISKTQREYFDRGELSESNYHIRTRKYSDMIREINRQIPLLKEELVMEGGLFWESKK
ncbi:MAG: hypothetical protein KAS04_06400, partial [Candidatus Aenigmarchaeota archaeon]|nr:hypothetical protein [Candidatus Aenigmarchaeota archaeon]